MWLARTGLPWWPAWFWITLMPPSSLASRRKIKHQMEILPRGGTDAGAMQRVRDGVPVITFSIPTRYIHTSVELVDKRDVQGAVRLLTAFLEDGQKADLTFV